jgi:hypothetical protein
MCYFYSKCCKQCWEEAQGELTISLSGHCHCRHSKQLNLNYLVAMWCSCTCYGFWRWTIAANVRHLNLSHFSLSFSWVDNSSSKSLNKTCYMSLHCLPVLATVVSQTCKSCGESTYAAYIIHDFVLYSPLKYAVFNFSSSLKVLAWNWDIHFIFHSYECVELFMKQNIIFVLLHWNCPSH